MKRGLRFVLASGERCGYFTDGRVYTGEPVWVREDGTASAVTLVADDYGGQRYIGEGPTPHVRPPRGVSEDRWRPASEFVAVALPEGVT